MKTPEDYMQEIQSASDADWERKGYTLAAPVFSMTKGSKYIKIIRTTFGSPSVHCFVDYQGNIYKAASWRVPAKGIRGHIDDAKKPLLGYDYYR